MGWSLWMPDENELLRRIDEVLYYVWDPMEVRSIPVARDEYRVWAPEVYMLVTSDVDANQLSTCLDEVARIWLGVESTPRSQEAADALLMWKERLRGPRRAAPNEAHHVVSPAIHRTVEWRTLA